MRCSFHSRRLTRPLVRACPRTDSRIPYLSSRLSVLPSCSDRIVLCAEELPQVLKLWLEYFLEPNDVRLLPQDMISECFPVGRVRGGEGVVMVQERCRQMGKSVTPKHGPRVWLAP